MDIDSCKLLNATTYEKIIACQENMIIEAAQVLASQKTAGKLHA